MCHYQNLFSVIGGKRGQRFHPPAREFAAALKSVTVSDIKSSFSGTNCMIRTSSEDVQNTGRRSHTRAPGIRNTATTTRYITKHPHIFPCIMSAKTVNYTYFSKVSYSYFMFLAD